MFQNIFVFLGLAGIIFDIILNIINTASGISICDSGPSGSVSCCAPETCPAIVKNKYTRVTGTFKYLNQVGIQTSIVLPPPFNNLNYNIRDESWQLFDDNQEQAQKFRNVFDAFDVLTSPKPIFFPTDVVYNGHTDPRQAAYTVDLRLFYNPVNWGRIGIPRFIRFIDCIVLKVPSTSLLEGDNSKRTIYNGVLLLAGGKGFEDDGKTILTGFDIDGVTPISEQATLENFIHRPATNSPTPSLSINDGYTFYNVEYTFKPNIAPLFQKNLVTLGCIPDVELNKNFISSSFASDAAIKAAQIKSIVFPDIIGTQHCLEAAFTTLRHNMTNEGLDDFKNTVDVCLQKLKDDTHKALSGMIGIGFDPCSSTFTLDYPVQFTSKPIKVNVSLKDRNGILLTTGLPATVADDLKSKIKAHVTFGNVGKFNYDGYQFFTTEITSDQAGVGQIMISFDNNILCNNNIPSDITVSPTRDLQVQEYKFVYAPSVPVIESSEGDGDGKPRRDEGDLSRDSVGDRQKDGV